MSAARQDIVGVPHPVQGRQVQNAADAQQTHRTRAAQYAKQGKQAFKHFWTGAAQAQQHFKRSRQKIPARRTAQRQYMVRHGQPSGAGGGAARAQQAGAGDVLRQRGIV